MILKFLIKSSDELRKLIYYSYLFINCRLIRKRKELFFEPGHPVYAINKRYDFEIIEEKVLPHFPDLVKKAYILRHDYGKNIILPEEKVDKRFLRNNKIACVIKDIQKARLFLNCRK